MTDKLNADEDNDDFIESFSLYYIFSAFPSFVDYYVPLTYSKYSSRC